MGKATDIVMALIVLIVAVFVFGRLGITWPEFWHDLQKFIYGAIQTSFHHGKPMSIAMMSMSARAKHARKIEEALRERWRKALEAIRRVIKH